MAIRFDSGFNEKLRREVKNYNQWLKRMEKSGYKVLPAPTKVSELKGRYSTRKELLKELNRLNSLRKKEVTEKIETKGGAKVPLWQIKYLKNNVENAISFFQKEHERVSKQASIYPAERMYINNLEAKIDLLNIDIDLMNQQQFRSAVASVNEFAQAPTRRKNQYRGFLDEIEWVMTNIGYPKDKRDTFFKKFEVLTPTQFLYAYENSNLITRIYRLYHKDYEDEEPRLTDTEENAEELINELLTQVDDIVADAKANTV